MKNKMQIIGVSLLSTVISSGHAGFYAGAGLGPDVIDFKQKGHVYQPGSFNVIEKTRLSGIGLFGTFFAGYISPSPKKFNLAAEVNINTSSASFNESNLESIHASFSSTHYKVNNSYGVSLLPGYQFLPGTLFYGRLAYSNAHFKISTSDASLANTSTRLDGFRYGLGAKQNVTPHIALRLDYSYVNYESTKIHSLDSLSNTIKNTKISPTQQLMELGVLYQID